jgi:hypothetical protein
VTTVQNDHAALVQVVTHELADVLAAFRTKFHGGIQPWTLHCEVTRTPPYMILFHHRFSILSIQGGV